MDEYHNRIADETMHEAFKWVGPWTADEGSKFGALEGGSTATTPEHLSELSQIVARFDRHVQAMEVYDENQTFIGYRYNKDEEPTKNLPRFNYMNAVVKTDASGKVLNNEELKDKFNDYGNMGTDSIGVGLGLFLNAATLGTRLLCKRRIIQPGFFGLYTSAGRYRIVLPGIRVLSSTSDVWAQTQDPRGILIDDEDNINRKFGDKVLLQVPENHLAGGFRIGATDEDAVDQEFVLFEQGRHVLPESNFYGVTVVQLSESRNVLGPLTILYVKEGELGGAFDRLKGQYRILYPGPPYVLHEQYWDNVEVVKRSGDIFRLGTYEFVTVKEGKIAGAFRRDTGEFQILPPGKSYMLHEKDFYPVEMIQRTEQFKIGPFYFITVQNGYEAGVYRVDTNQFVRLPPGHTYQLNRKDFYEPISVKRVGHQVVVGPLTFVTVKDGMLNGAYRTKDGKFIEFNEVKEWVLHEKEYHGIVSCDKNLPVKQDFGPNRIITIREGFRGIFEEEGRISVREPGFYKEPANVVICEPICVKVFIDRIKPKTSREEDLTFITKDGIKMSVSASITWFVDDPELVHKSGGQAGGESPFDFTQKKLLSLASDQLVRQCKMKNRGELLPAEPDMKVYHEEGRSEKEVNEMAEAAYVETVASIASKVIAEMKDQSKASKMGVQFLAVNIDLFKLLDLQILADLERVTKTITERNAQVEQSKAQEAMASAQQEAEQKLKFMKQEEALKLSNMKVEEEAAKTAAMAKAAAEQKEIEATSKARIAELNYEAETKEKLARAKAKAEVDKLDADSKNKIAQEEQATIDKINVGRAEAEAAAIMAKAEAEYQAKLKAADAGSKMPQQEFELKKMELQVQMMSNIAKEVGQAAWKYPDVYTGFIEEFADKLRLGPMAANEILAAHMNKKADIDGEAGMKPPAGGGLFPLAGNLRSGR